MNSSKNGTCISDCSISDINGLGMYILVQDKEYFIPFREYPRFMKATISELANIDFLPPFQLRWNDLDVDIELQALEQPENFPLVFR